MHQTCACIYTIMCIFFNDFMMITGKKVTENEENGNMTNI